MITWNGILYNEGSDNENNEEGSFLKESGNISLDFVICLKNSFIAKGMDSGFTNDPIIINQCRYYATTEYNRSNPWIYFKQPAFDSLYLSGSSVTFKVILKSSGLTGDQFGISQWHNKNSNGTFNFPITFEKEFTVTCNDPGAFPASIKMQYDSDYDGDIDTNDKWISASTNINVIEMGDFTCKDITTEGGHSLTDTTDDHATPDETMYNSSQKFCPIEHQTSQARDLD